MFLTFLTEKLASIEKVRNAYGSEKEMMEHFLSGEVTIPFTDILKYVDEYENSEEIQLPSRYQVDDKVLLCLMPEGNISDSFPGLISIVRGVHFFRGKVKYDLEIKFYGDISTRIYNVDSIYVLPHSA